MKETKEGCVGEFGGKGKMIYDNVQIFFKVFRVMISGDFSLITV